MKRLSLIALAAILLSPVANAQELVREFRGTGDAQTAEFFVEGPWLLDWRLDGEYSSMLALEIHLVEGRGGRHVGRVLRTQRRGNGVKLFEEGGAYRLRISSTLAQWRIRIQQITEEEAELYTPRRENRDNE